MAKRRAEDTLLHDSASKRCFPPICSVDMQLGSVAASTGTLSPPSLLALLGSRCRKRPHYFEDPEKPEEEEDAETVAALCRKPSHCDTRRHAVNGASSHERLTSSKKRSREEHETHETVLPKVTEKVDEENAEDCTYNSFQFWRVPLPELDLSLLENTDDHSQTKDKSKVKDPSANAMET